LNDAGPLFANVAEREVVPEGAGDEPRVFRVAELDRALKRNVESAYPVPVWVEGEVVNASHAASGHVYFTLKDEAEDAAIDAVMYRTAVTPKGRALLANGNRIRLRGKPTLWVPRGRLQLVGDRVDAAGRGALLEALEKLRKQLAAEGLFDAARKRPLPSEPRCIGVVSSASGAVIHDIKKVAHRRGGAHILLAPALVQGAGAPESIVRALGLLERVMDVDVIVVARGGGASDDLGAFNDERVVRAVVGCRVPVVSAVGHETDVTLTDFAADARAATPSQAAECIVADRSARIALLAETKTRLATVMTARLRRLELEVLRAQKRLGDPHRLVAEQAQRLDDLSARLADEARVCVTARQARLTDLERRLLRVHPQTVLARLRAERTGLHQRLVQAATQRVLVQRRNLAAAAETLHALSPLRVLGRGYSIVQTEGGRAVRGPGDVRPGDRLRVRVQHALLGVEVTDVREIPS
jgi:exodeoxyribonuclease VII large subunit